MQFARNSVEFRVLLSRTPHAGVLIDPMVDGNGACITRKLLRGYPPERVILYVDQTAPSLRAVLELSHHGISNVFVHPVSKASKTFYNTVDNLKAFELSTDLESAINGRMASLPDGLSRVISDVLRRPYRYQSAQDIAVEAGISARSLYRAFKEAQFGSPRGILAIAKVAHGFSHLHDRSVREVSRALGYSRPHAFSKHVCRYTGAIPSKLKSETDRCEVVISLVENLFKPTPLPRQGRIPEAGSKGDMNGPQ